MASVFSDVLGIIFIDYLENLKTINGEYCSNLLQRLNEKKSSKNGRILAKKKVLFHQYNVPAHKSVTAMAKMNELKFELLPHAPYLPDLSSSDHSLFPNLKKWLSGQRFSNDEEVMSAVNDCLEEQGSFYYKKGVKVISAETAAMRLFTGGEATHGTEASFTYNRSKRSEYWIFIIRLYINGPYHEPPPEMLPPVPEIVDQSCCSIT
ncbi:mariner transposase [Trichonephila clavipes]|nr:mariner transposase [Trichonephila clavipes]